VIPEHDPPRDPRTAACFGFILAVISGVAAVIALIQWWDMAEYLKNIPRHTLEGGKAFSWSLPVFVIEFVCYAFGFPALVSLLAVVCWKPAMLRSWFFVAAMICLVPTMVLFLARCGIRVF
jgi:hypothetical protein